MADAKNAPLPWMQYCGGNKIYDGDRYFIAVVQSKNAEDDTAFIVKACNAYYDFLSALQEIAGNGDGTGRNPQLMVDVAVAAIARAEGRS